MPTNYTNHAQPTAAPAEVPGKTTIPVSGEEVAVVNEIAAPASEAVAPVADVSVAPASRDILIMLIRLGKATKAYRVSHGWTHAQFTEKLNNAVGGKKVFSEAQAKRLESGKLSITIEQLAALATILPYEDENAALRRINMVVTKITSGLLDGVSLTSENIDLFV